MTFLRIEVGGAGGFISSVIVMVCHSELRIYIVLMPGCVLSGIILFICEYWELLYRYLTGKSRAGRRQ